LKSYFFGVLFVLLKSALKLTQLDSIEEVENLKALKEFRMGRFERGGDQRRDFGGRGGGFRRDFGPREMHKAKCSDCGADCEVPFKPVEGRPVYCKDCYAKHRKY